MTVQTSLIPLGHPIAESNLFVNQQWAFWFQQFSQALPPQGSGYVIDGSAQSYGPMTIYQGAASNRGAYPTLGDVYIAVDTGQTFVEQGGQWVLQLPAFTGDVTSNVNSSVLSLPTVNQTVGTFGNSINVPQLTVDAKGRVTNVVNVPISVPGGTPGGPNNSIQFNNNGVLSGNTALYWVPGTQSLNSRNQFVNGTISFQNPVPTFTNLSPLTSKGDLLGHNGTINVRVPVGNNGQVLVANTAASAGISWTSASFSDSTTPYFIPSGQTFVNNEYKQNLFTIPIDVEGDIVVDGYLIEV